LYSFSGVVHRLSRSLWIYSGTQTVNNAVAMPNSNFVFQKEALQCNFGFGSGTNRKSARWTSLAQSFDRSRNPNADTHSQVLTPYVSEAVKKFKNSSKHTKSSLIINYLRPRISGISTFFTTS